MPKKKHPIGSRRRPNPKANSNHKKNSRPETVADNPLELAENKWESNHNTFPVVGIGGSAGGLEAFTEIIQEIPENTGMAFVYVQHMAPDHESKLAEILKRSSRIPVENVADGLLLRPNHLYVSVPNREITIANGR